MRLRLGGLILGRAYFGGGGLVIGILRYLFLLCPRLIKLGFIMKLQGSKIDVCVPTEVVSIMTINANPN